MWKIKCNGPTGMNCHVYDYDGKEVRCLGLDLEIIPGELITANILVLVDELEIEVDDTAVSAQKVTREEQRNGRW